MNNFNFALPRRNKTLVGISRLQKHLLTTKVIGVKKDAKSFSGNLVYKKHNRRGTTRRGLTLE